MTPPYIFFILWLIGCILILYSALYEKPEDTWWAFYGGFLVFVVLSLLLVIF